jgi:hypothetical protein
MYFVSILTYEILYFTSILKFIVWSILKLFSLQPKKESLSQSNRLFKLNKT